MAPDPALPVAHMSGETNWKPLAQGWMSALAFLSVSLGIPLETLTENSTLD